jgi:hypothetical protein
MVVCIYEAGTVWLHTERYIIITTGNCRSGVDWRTANCEWNHTSNTAVVPLPQLWHLAVLGAAYVAKSDIYLSRNGLTRQGRPKRQLARVCEARGVMTS